MTVLVKKKSTAIMLYEEKKQLKYSEFKNVTQNSERTSVIIRSCAAEKYVFYKIMEKSTRIVCYFWQLLY